jgi:F1F0 ATPase subunit 2
VNAWFATTWVGPLLLGVVVGIGAGAAFFGGLALTVARLPDARRPGMLLVASLLLRLALIGATLLVLARWLTPGGVLGAALGVLIARTVMLRAAAGGTRGPSRPTTTPTDRDPAARSEVSEPWT